MRHQFKLAAFFNAILLACTTSVLTLNHWNFEVDKILDREKLISYVSAVLCSIDIKYTNIYFELESEGRLLDGIIADSSSCTPPSMTIMRYKTETGDALTSRISGARLIILLAKELELENPMFPRLFRIRRKQSFNLFYMIVSEMKLSDDHDNLLKVMYQNYSLLNAVVVAMEDDNPSVITYNPFTNETLRIPNNAHKREELFVKKNSNIFGNPIVVVVYKDIVSKLTRGGISNAINFNYDTFLPELISSAMNATLILKTPYLIDTKSKDMSDADLTINGRSYAFDSEIEDTITLRRNDVCILLPYNRIRNTFDVISRTVDPFVWMSMILVTFLVWVSLILHRWFQRREAWERVFLFDLFGFHMNQPLTHMPTKVAPRLIIASCLMYCLVIKSVFKGLLYISIVRNEETRISTIQELLSMNEHEILVTNVFQNYTKYFLGKTPIKNRFKVVDVLEFSKRINSHEIQYGFVGSKRGAKFFENTHIVDGLPVFYVMDECIVPFMTRYFVRLGSPFVDRINQLLRLAEESGLFDYWEEQLFNAYNKLKQRQQLFAQHSAIDLELLDFVFHIWGYGLAIATVIFIIERFVLRQIYLFF